MTHQEKEKEVFAQEVSREELKHAAGGECGDDWDVCGQTQGLNCIDERSRNIYGGNGFPNCAATVEDWSLCKENDACWNFAVIYKSSLKDCYKAWR